MARDSIAHAKAELYALLNGNVSGVTTTFPCEPRIADKPVSVSVFTMGMDPTDYLLGVRIYRQADDDAQAAQDDLDALIMAVDVVLGSTARFGPSNWLVEYDPVIDWWIATSQITVGREDAGSMI